MADRLVETELPVGRALPVGDVGPVAHDPALGRPDRIHALDEEAVLVDRVEAPAGFFLGQALGDHGVENERGNADAGRACAEQHDALFLQGNACHLDRREKRAGGDGRGALDVVVEGAEPVAIGGEQAAGVLAGEILPLQEDVRPALFDRANEIIDESVVILAAHALVPPAEVERVVQAVDIVGTDVEQDRQRVHRVDAGAGDIERQLADRDAHAAGALIAETQNALAVADHDDAHVVEMLAGEDFGNSMPVRIAEEDAARLAPDLAEPLASFADGRRIDERQKLLDMFHEHRIEQRLVRIFEIAQKGVFLEIAGDGAQRFYAAVELLVEGADMGRQQPVQAQRVAFGLGEGRALVEHRVIDEGEAAQMRRQRPVPVVGTRHRATPCSIEEFAPV